MNSAFMQCGHRAFWPVIVLIALTGCSLLPSPEPVDQEAVRPTWENHRDDMVQITHWDLDGRVSARTEDDGANFNVRWQQADDNYSIRISGPLGQSVATVTGGAGWVQLDTSDDTLTGDSLEDILSRTTSIDLPLHLLRYWVRGIPAPDSSADFTLDDTPVIVFMEQAGWTVDYRSYHDDLGLPRRLDIERGEQSARIVISVWTLE